MVIHDDDFSQDDLDVSDELEACVPSGDWG